jgi:hypothetical protein
MRKPPNMLTRWVVSGMRELERLEKERDSIPCIPCMDRAARTSRALGLVFSVPISQGTVGM